jgi:hypothetical protein
MSGTPPNNSCRVSEFYILSERQQSVNTRWVGFISGFTFDGCIDAIWVVIGSPLWNASTVYRDAKTINIAEKILILWIWEIFCENCSFIKYNDFGQQGRAKRCRSCSSSYIKAALSGISESSLNRWKSYLRDACSKWLTRQIDCRILMNLILSKILFIFLLGWSGAFSADFQYPSFLGRFETQKK